MPGTSPLIQRFRFWHFPKVLLVSVDVDGCIFISIDATKIEVVLQDSGPLISYLIGFILENGFTHVIFACGSARQSVTRNKQLSLESQTMCAFDAIRGIMNAVKSAFNNPKLVRIWYCDILVSDAMLRREPGYTIASDSKYEEPHARIAKLDLMYLQTHYIAGQFTELFPNFELHSLHVDDKTEISRDLRSCAYLMAGDSLTTLNYPQYRNDFLSSLEVIKSDPEFCALWTDPNVFETVRRLYPLTKTYLSEKLLDQAQKIVQAAVIDAESLQTPKATDSLRSIGLFKREHSLASPYYPRNEEKMEIPLAALSA